MKYFIGYLIEGQAAQWHSRVAREIFEKFNNYKIHEKIPPHLTIYRPFDTTDVGPLKNLLAMWVNNFSESQTLFMNDFGQFDEKVIFASVSAPTSLIKIITDLQIEIRSKGVNSIGETFPSWHPHATLANYLQSEKFKKIWSHVLTLPKPDFSLPFNNVTLFHSTNEEGWEVKEYFPIK